MPQELVSPTIKASLHRPDALREDKGDDFTDALTIDVEDYFHVDAFSDRIARSEWSGFPSRVRWNTEHVLSLLEKHRCLATFFVLGWVAERDPALVRTIAEAGHELGCHSYAHARVTGLKPQEFREDLRRARGAIEDAAGTRVVGYRAPTFSIVRKNLWALRILAEEGFLYDSSIFPIRHDRYGYPEFPRFLQQVDFGQGLSIYEVPMSTVRIAGTNLPCGGGGYLRLLPMSYTRWAVRRVHRKDKQPVVFYFHPWEIDPGQPKLKGKWKSRFRHRVGLMKMERRVGELLSRGRFMPLVSLIYGLATSRLEPDLLDCEGRMEIRS